MKHPILLLAALATLVSSAAAQDWALERLNDSPRHIEWVSIRNGDRNIQASITYPEVSTRATAVVVIHEIFGLTDWVRSVTDQLAEAGYIAIAPDLLSGLGPNGRGSAELGEDGARGVINTLPQDQITADLSAVVSYVAALPAANGKVAVAGFCWGGGTSFTFATNNPGISAVFSFYGPQPSDPAAIARIRAPVYGFYAANDMRVNATIDRTRELMSAAGKTYEPVIYNEGSGHGFLRAGEDPAGNEANKAARAAAWTRWLALLREV
jgi:carboxymethylenebutenolidase